MLESEKLLGIALTIAFATMSVYIIHRARFFNTSGIPKKLLISAFFFKLGCSFMVGTIYSDYYTDRSKADTYKYFDDSEILFNSIHQAPGDFFKMLTGIDSENRQLQPYYNQMNFWYDTYSPVNDNRAIIRLNAAIRLISFGHYHVHAVLFCLLSFAGIIAVIKALAVFHPHHTQMAFLPFIIIPSVVFWNSGLLKDSLSLCVLGFTVLSMATFYRRRKLIDVFFVSCCLFLLFNIRFQIFLLMIPIILAWIAAIQARKRSGWVFAGTFTFLIIAIMLVWKPVFDSSFIEVLSKKRQAFIDLAMMEQSHSLFSSRNISENFPNVALEPLIGFWNAMTRPYLTIHGGATILTASIESMLVCGFLILLAYKTIKSRKREWSLFLTMSVVMAITYLCVMGMTTPISGALVRYKALVLPFIVIPLAISSGLRVNFDQSLKPKFFFSEST